MRHVIDNLIVLIPCILVLAFAVYLVYLCVKGQNGISSEDYKEWCEENDVEYEEE